MSPQDDQARLRDMLDYARKAVEAIRDRARRDLDQDVVLAAPYAAEIGVASTLPVLGAVAHAIANATGTWIKDLPITPEKILNALRGALGRGST